jgi:hypothetical protein
MLKRSSAALLLVAALPALASCTSRQLYDSAAGWRENECMKILDTPRRERCLKEADRPYDEYKKP